ncbi:MAG: T9SS type B sorting domain-containing protein [Chitinophagaceae bacterium]|nr:MAG: T9SS type B sorting domain-containing protein [Chitinophagaceae bacterium]
MRLFLLSLLCLCAAASVQAQGFNFSCARDTTLRSCDPVCVNLQAKVPDLRANTSTYNVAPLSNVSGCFIPYVQPDDPAGQATSLVIDDKYSTAINIGFTFPFFGTNYTQCVASTNGLVSFDISKATQFSHYAMLRNGGTLSATSGVPQDLPSTLYDKLLIMGPYHDINPATTTSPNRRIQYQVFGVAPYRRWILSFYKVPQFSCSNLIENTHQIVLYESTGIVEVFVFSRQSCSAWNQGRAMIGMQNESRTSAIMAPGRKASDPVWEGLNMNESWRFVPASGGSLLKRVELFDMTGTLVGLGTVGTSANGATSVEFPNICVSTVGSTPFRMRAVYEKIDDPSVEIYGNDTIRINRPGLPFSIGVVSAAATCTTPSSITLTPQPGGGVPPFTYAIAPFGNPAGVYQSANVFLGVAPGLYNAFVKDATGCESSQPIFVNFGAAGIAGSATSTPSGCTVPTGTVTATWISGGTAPYTYQLNSGAIQNDGNFTAVPSGSHVVTIRDNAGCLTQITVNVGINNNPTASATSTASGCTVNNGSITATALTGLAPYTYALDGSTTYQASNVFNNVGVGPHTVTVKDAGGCTVTINAPVAQTANPSASATVTATGCGAPSGTATLTATGGIAPYTYCLGPSGATSCQTAALLTGLPAGQQFLSVKDANGCVGIVDITIPTSTPPTATATSTASGCTPSGTITVTPAGGLAPYTYQLDAGTAQNTNVFTAVGTGNHTIVITDARSCSVTINVVVGGTTPPAATAATTVSGCNPASGTITVTATGTAPFTYALGTGTFQPSNAFTGLAAGNYSIQVRDNVGCTSTITATVGSSPAVAASATAANTLCTSNTGSVSVTATAGTAPYTYTLSGTSTAQPSNQFNNLAAGSYTVTVTDALGCTAATAPVTVGQTNNITITPATSIVSGCVGTSQTVSLTTNASSVSWSPATGVANPASANTSITIGTAPTYTVTAGTGACTATATVTVQAVQPPQVNAGAQQYIQVGDSVRLLAAVSPTGTYSYSWSPGITLRDSTVLQPWARPAVTTAYTLTVTTPQGCVGRDSVTVVILGDCIDPHNAFTPNGDGINDNWLVTNGAGCTTRIVAQVFNRYGGRVYENQNYRGDWNGTYQGKHIADGTYYYQVVYYMTDGRIVTRRGDVTIVR